MIKYSLFFIVAGWLGLTSAYGNAEIKPPEGPFVSLLQTTFSVKPTLSVDVKKTTIKEKVYNFQVPDLGRYQENTPATIPSQFESIRTPAFSTFDKHEIQNSGQNHIIDSEPLDVPVNAFNELNESPFALTPDRQESRVNSNQARGFDSLPIEYLQSEQERSYPAEWASSFSQQPLQPNNAYNMRNPRQNQPFFQNNQNQPSPMMGMPFSNQMPLWPLGNRNNSNAGYK